MAENLRKRPAKGILKSSSSFEKTDGPKQNKYKETKWDEMNILATLHPPGKDYGHMKIDEPKTPFHQLDDEDHSGDEADGLDADMLAKKIQIGANLPPKALREDEEPEEEDEDLSPEERMQKKIFETKRKAHYNEFYAVKLARKLMEEEEDFDEEEEGSGDRESDGTGSDGEEPGTSARSINRKLKNKKKKSQDGIQTTTPQEAPPTVQNDVKGPPVERKRSSKAKNLPDAAGPPVERKRNSKAKSLPDAAGPSSFKHQPSTERKKSVPPTDGASSHKPGTSKK